jgi:hypothetical protein
VKKRLLLVFAAGLMSAFLWNCQSRESSIKPISSKNNSAQIYESRSSTVTWYSIDISGFAGVGTGAVASSITDNFSFSTTTGTASGQLKVDFNSNREVVGMSGDAALQ